MCSGGCALPSGASVLWLPICQWHCILNLMLKSLFSDKCSTVTPEGTTQGQPGGFAGFTQGLSFRYKASSQNLHSVLMSCTGTVNVFKSPCSGLGHMCGLWAGQKEARPGQACLVGMGLKLLPGGSLSETPTASSSLPNSAGMNGICWLV